MKSGRPPASSADARERMRRQKRAGTQPEVEVARLLRSVGAHYRAQSRNRDLPGRPDFANRRRRWVVFVHGCYWHQHEGCLRATIPKENREWWVAKFQANKARDARALEAILALGMRAEIIWECELREPEPVLRRLRALTAVSGPERTEA